MKKKKNGAGLRTLIIVLAVCLLAVAALITWKQWEYSASEDFYNGLRGAVAREGAMV